jgi:hypothetical protein
MHLIDEEEPPLQKRKGRPPKSLNPNAHRIKSSSFDADSPLPIKKKK